MTCREFADFVMSYLDGELEATQRRRFEDHLAECVDCVRFLREYRATTRAGQSAYADDLPTDVPDDLVKAILDAPAPVDCCSMKKPLSMCEVRRGSRPGLLRFLAGKRLHDL